MLWTSLGRDSQCAKGQKKEKKNCLQTIAFSCQLGHSRCLDHGELIASFNDSHCVKQILFFSRNGSAALGSPAGSEVCCGKEKG